VGDELKIIYYLLFLKPHIISIVGKAIYTMIKFNLNVIDTEYVCLSFYSPANKSVVSLEFEDKSIITKQRSLFDFKSTKHGEMFVILQINNTDLYYYINNCFYFEEENKSVEEDKKYKGVLFFINLFLKKNAYFQSIPIWWNQLTNKNKDIYTNPFFILTIVSSFNIGLNCKHYDINNIPRCLSKKSIEIFQTTSFFATLNSIKLPICFAFYNTCKAEFLSIIDLCIEEQISDKSKNIKELFLIDKLRSFLTVLTKKCCFSYEDIEYGNKNIHECNDVRIILKIGYRSEIEYLCVCYYIVKYLIKTYYKTMNKYNDCGVFINTQNSHVYLLLLEHQNKNVLQCVINTGVRQDCVDTKKNQFIRVDKFSYSIEEHKIYKYFSYPPRIL